MTPAGTVTVGVTDITILGRNPLRLWAMIQQLGTGNVNLSFGSTAATTTIGYRLESGDAIVFGLSTSLPYIGEVRGIASAAGQDVRITEIDFSELNDFFKILKHVRQGDLDENFIKFINPLLSHRFGVPS